MAFPKAPQTNTAVLPPPPNSQPPVYQPYQPEHPLPWSKLVIAALILDVLGIILAYTPAAGFGMFLGIIAFFLSIVGLFVIVIRKSRRNTLLAFIAIVLSIVAFICGATNAISSNPTGQTSSTSTADAKLANAQTTLKSKIDEAHKLLDSSNKNVANPRTRVDLTNAINTASAVESEDPQQYTDAVNPLQQAMDAVNASEQQKKDDDAAAAKKAADEAAAKKAADEAAAAKKAAEQKAAADAAAAKKAQQQKSQQPATAAPVGTAHGGAYCSPEGARAKSDRSSNILTCKPAKDGLLRWQN